MSPYVYERVSASISGTVRALARRDEGPSPASGDGGWTSYDSMIVAHALCGFIAWQIVAPAAVLVKMLGKRDNRTILGVHGLMQLCLTLPLTVIGVVLGRIATNMGNKPVDTHKVLGYMILLLLWIQLILGYTTHLRAILAKWEAPATNSGPTNRFTVNWLHIGLGMVLLGAGGVQVALGLNEYTARPIARGIIVVHWLFQALPPALFISYYVVRATIRIRRGTPFLDALLSRGPPTDYSPPGKPWVGDSTHRESMDGGGYTYPGPSTGIGGTEIGSWQGVSTREDYEKRISSFSGQTRHGDDGEEGEGLLREGGNEASTSHHKSPYSSSQLYDPPTLQRTSFDGDAIGYLHLPPPTPFVSPSFPILSEPPLPCLQPFSSKTRVPRPVSVESAIEQSVTGVLSRHSTGTFGEEKARMEEIAEELPFPGEGELPFPGE